MKKFITVFLITGYLAAFTPSEASLLISSNGCINFGSAASLNNRHPYTFLIWVYRTGTIFAGGRFYGKGSAATQQEQFAYNGTSGNVRIIRTRAGVDLQYVTNDTPMDTANKWMFLAATVNTGNAAGQRGNIYHGDLMSLAVESTYGTATDGDASNDSQAADNFMVGHDNSCSGSNTPQRIAYVQYIARELTLGEIRSLQFHPRVVAGTVLLSHLGFNGVGTQADLSGSKNNGTVTNSAATTSPHVPLRSPFGF